MKVLLQVSIVLLLIVSARAQMDVRQQQAEQVRLIVQSFGSRPTKVNLLTRSLVFYSEKIVISGDTSFHLRRKTESGKKVLIEIEFENVLELAGAEKSVSFVPDGTARNYGSFKDVGRIFPGTRVLVVYADKKADLRSEIGFAHSVSTTHMTIFDKNGRERIDLPLEQVMAVYGLIGGYGGVKAGASKGAEGIGNSPHALLGGVFAGAGALLGLVKSDGRPILIYSR